MRRRLNFKLVGVCAVLCVLLLVPAAAQGKEDVGAELKEQKMQLIKQLKLGPDKEKAMLELEEKYSAEREKILDSTMNALDNLQAELKKAKPDEAKVQDLVKSLTTSQDNLFDSFKEQRDKEMALMSPLEEGRYLLALGKWRDEMMEEYEKEEPEKKGK